MSAEGSFPGGQSSLSRLKEKDQLEKLKGRKIKWSGIRRGKSSRSRKSKSKVPYVALWLFLSNSFNLKEWNKQDVTIQTASNGCGFIDSKKRKLVNKITNIQLLQMAVNVLDQMTNHQLLKKDSYFGLVMLTTVSSVCGSARIFCIRRTVRSDNDRMTIYVKTVTRLFIRYLYT